MQLRIAAVALLALLAAPAFAQEAAWMRAGSIVQQADDDVHKSGLAGIGPHVAALEQAMADGAADFPPKPGPDGKAIALTDGPAETLLALAAAANRKEATVAHPNPYAEAGLLLTLHYNEVHQPEDALRVVALTLKLKPVSGAYVGVRDAALLTEEVAAFDTLKRFDEAMGAADAALKASQNDRDKARSQRARGFDLVELGRLDDGAAAYQESLKLEPGNALATRELGYIAQLRAGGAKAPPRLFTVPQPQQAAPN